MVPNILLWCKSKTTENTERNYNHENNPTHGQHKQKIYIKKRDRKNQQQWPSSIEGYLTTNTLNWIAIIRKSFARKVML